jgi:hypothetical protein
LKNQAGDVRLYQKGVGFLVAPMMLEVSETKGKVKLLVWIRVNLFVRIFSLFILPARMGVESGGMRGVLPRKIARTAVNKLLVLLNLKLIE